MKIIMRACLILWIISFPLLSCVHIKEPEFIAVENIKLDNLSFASTTLTADLHFFNPNGLGVTLFSSDLDVYVNQSNLGHISKEHNIEISRKSKFIIPVALNLDIRKLLLTGLKSQLTDKTQIRVVGTVIIKKAGLKKKLAVDYATEKDLSLIKI